MLLHRFYKLSVVIVTLTKFGAIYIIYLLARLLTY